jgi:hypothetical protein
MILTKRLQLILDKWKTRIREKAEIVEHETYGGKTIVDPLPFAVYETALKATYVNWQIYHKERENWSEFMGCQVYHQIIGDRNNISLPWIEDDWGHAEGLAAEQDYRYCCSLLAKEEGEDEKGEPTNLYYALLD